MAATKRRVCVIGAGPSGLSCLYHFSKLEKEGKEIPEVVCYDKQGHIGGLWNFTWRTGVDQYGEPCHESMYRNLWTNMPKECLEYPDYTFERHFGKPIPSYPQREVIRHYLQGRFEQENVSRFIKFKTIVRRVEYDSENDEFVVIVKDLVADQESREKFSHVFVATGHFSFPNVPDFDGIETFPGNIWHSTDFKDARGYVGHDVLIIGAGRSAEDLALQLIKYGANSVICSWRDKPMGFNWPNGIEERPLLVNVDKKEVTFRDNSRAKVDTIVYCTGYIYNFPFLPDDLRLKTDLTFYPADLYKGIVWMKGGNNKLFYFGMQDQFYTFTMFDVQADWACRVAIGERTLPGKKEMQKDIDEWLKSNAACKEMYEKIDFQTAYIEDIRKETPREDSLSVAMLFNEWHHHRQEGITTYRDRVFNSIWSNQNAIKPSKTWMENFVDTLEEVFGSDQERYRKGTA